MSINGMQEVFDASTRLTACSIVDNIIAVVVSYNPDIERFARLCESLQYQVSEVVVVDNGSSNSFRDWVISLDSRIPFHLVVLGENKGVAAAQNVGISFALNRGAEYVILFDHDSVPAGDMVSRLYYAAVAKTANGLRVAAVGARYVDHRQNNPPPFIRAKGFNIERQNCPCLDSIVEVSYLISSGCLIPSKVFDTVGMMQEELFIDYVDIEWGLRARMNGFLSFGVCGALMEHDLGDSPIFFLGKNYPSHSALRHYYHFRNAVWLYRQNWVPFHWKCADGYRLILKYLFYSAFAKPRLSQWWMMTKGIFHGLFGKMGASK